MDDLGSSDQTRPDSLQLSEPGDGRGVNQDLAGFLPVDEDLFFDWDALYSPQNDIEFNALDAQSSWIAPISMESHMAMPLPGLRGDEVLPVQAMSSQLETLPFEEPETNLDPKPPLALSGFDNVAQWLDGAFRPPVPCYHCHKYRLQCLILRRSAANPNPIPACSSCVGLFRPCSFANGEKRQASGFETLSPAFGHLHGLPEHENDGTINESGDPGDCLRKTEGKETRQFVRKGARVLRDWFYQNEDRPYPSDEEKARLAQETGFSKQRISTWFANARRRQKQKQQHVSSIQVYRAGSPMPIDRTPSMTPMERWQASPPDEEPISESVIQEAISSTSVGSEFDRQTQVDRHSLDLSLGHDDRSLASSLSSFSGLASDASDSSSSAWSYQSHGDGPLHARPHRRPISVGRRRGRRKLVAEDNRYQCTFCTESFKKKHDWSRHEKSVHLQLDAWICTPDPTQLESKGTSSPLQCRLCDELSPSPSHWESHNFQECASKPVSERSFSRKDYLWQHLRKFHGCTTTPVADLGAWRSSQNEIQSRCGFCEAILPTWSARADHLAGHFKEGCRMSQWTGDWGFDTTVLGNLRDALLPFERSLERIPL